MRLGRRLPPLSVRQAADRTPAGGDGEPARRLHRAHDGADIALDKVFEKAVETGTFVEINGQPDRLDLRDVHARLAGEAGARICIDTDAHEVRALGWAELGIGLARRAWLTKEQILNTRPWAEIESTLP